MPHFETYGVKEHKDTGPECKGGDFSSSTRTKECKQLTEAKSHLGDSYLLCSPGCDRFLDAFSKSFPKLMSREHTAHVSPTLDSTAEARLRAQGRTGPQMEQTWPPFSENTI